MTEVRPNRDPLVAPGGIDHHVADMTATASSDVTLKQYQDQLGKSGQWFPMDGDPEAPLGTLIERNSTGPLRLGYGAWRDLLLGIQFENGRGELITAGGRTVKNVAGYDLTKFMIGQSGIFGKIVTVTTRTYRRPDGALLARFVPDTRVMHRLIPSDCRPQWTILTADALLCGYVADRATLDFYASSIKQFRPIDVTSRSLEDDIDHRVALWKVNDEPSFRAAVPPSRLSEFVAGGWLERWVADAAFGIVQGNCHADRREALIAAARRLGGSVSFRQADGSIAELHADATEHRILERLKRAFDPDGHLAALPGATQNA
jgi:FAD/FMN-containing dehydrogenase